MKSIKHFLLWIFAGLAVSCGSDDKNSADKDHGPSAAVRTFSPEEILKVDLNQDISQRSLQELRLLRSALYARQGFCFMEADLRGYFSAHMPGYDSIMEARFWAEDSSDPQQAFPPIKLNDAETAFVKRIEQREAELKKQNFVQHGDYTMANTSNIINAFQFTSLPPDLMGKLAENNFAIVESDDIQHFHVYEKNDYAQIPNFVSTDMYLQLYHMYFSYMLRSLEEEKFVPAITALSEGMYNESIKLSASTADPAVKELADYNATFYAIPYKILTGDSKNLPSKYQQMFEDELSNIESAADSPSQFMDMENVNFPYSLFKPRGHYTRSDTLQRYFKAMMWLQTAAMCRDNELHLRRASLMALLCNQGRTDSGESLRDTYNSVFETIVFLIGEPDNLSVMDLCSTLQTAKITDASALLKPAQQKALLAQMKKLSESHNKITPKVAVSCVDKINFMPQRYLFDNEILQEMVDIKKDAKRALPRGLDVFASLGNTTAEKILTEEYNDDEAWKDFVPTLKNMKAKFSTGMNWNATVYTKWMYALKSMQEQDPAWPSFMKTDMWNRKNLNTSLASWADLKHDAILYGEQPSGAECGDGGPPPPITVGYVEPNVKFWEQMNELLQLTQKVLRQNDLLTPDLKSKGEHLAETSKFLLTASKKELRHETLSEQEYNTIEYIGATVEYLTLSIIEPGLNLPSWQEVKGPDKSVAVVADVYTRNIPGDSKSGILHEAVGNVNELYVVVEISGYLYLTKGSTFSYYEFLQDTSTRLTDEEWQKMLEQKKNIPAIPDWMKGLILQRKDAPKSDDKIFYSSGC